MTLSVIIPTFNGSSRIHNCIDALLSQSVKPSEIIVVDDGSTDSVGEFVLSKYQGAVHLISQRNRGPAAARNSGAKHASGSILIFVDDDCKPLPDFLENLTSPFKCDPTIAAAKGAYLTEQQNIIARFRQQEYEERYFLMARHKEIDFIDTYAAAIRKVVFENAGGFDENLIAAEDIDLSYRLSNLGYKLVFLPKAIVFHQHDDTIIKYLKKKYTFAFWRILALKKNPNKAVSDSHTPQLMKVQVLLCPLVIVSLMSQLVFTPAPSSSLFLFLSLLFIFTNKDLLRIAWQKDRLVFLLILPLTLLRGLAQFFGVTKGFIVSLKNILIRT